MTIDGLDAQVRARAKTDPRVTTLTALPGIGPFTALVILAEAGDITRFGSARKLASWAGLTPTVRGSDLTVRHGHISKQGSAWLRWAQPGRPDRQTLPGVLRHLRRDQQTAREEDRHDRDLPQAADPRLPPAHRPSGRHPRCASTTPRPAGVTKPRVSSLMRHELATGRAR